MIYIEQNKVEISGTHVCVFDIKVGRSKDTVKNLLTLHTKGWTRNKYGCSLRKMVVSRLEKMVEQYSGPTNGITTPN